MYIVIEGQDATGKDTQAQLLAEHLRKQGKNVIHYAESGTASTDPFITEIARLNYGSTQDIDHCTRTLLYLVNRYEQWRKLAEPALKNADTVITTRNWLSTLIYEGYAAGVNLVLIEKIHKSIMPATYFKPDRIVILTLSDSDRRKRLTSQGKRHSEIFKSKTSAFQKKINNAYLNIAQNFSINTLDASGSPTEVHTKLVQLFRL